MESFLESLRKWKKRTHELSKLARRRTKLQLHTVAMSHDVETMDPSDPTSNQHKRSKGEKKKRKRDNAEEQSHVEKSPTKRSRSQPSGLVNGAEQQSAEQSPFCTATFSLYLPLAPVSQLHPVSGICAEHLSPLILTYYPPLKGVVLSYSNVTLSEYPTEGSEQVTKDHVLAKTIDEFAASFVWVTAEFLLLRSQRGAMIEGQINLQNESHIGLVCFNCSMRAYRENDCPRVGHGQVLILEAEDGAN